jgi:HEPN domain-containing protein
MVDSAIVREWLDKADGDFSFAQINLEEGKLFFAQICFHFQQAAEKYLKAYIVAHELSAKGGRP